MAASEKTNAAEIEDDPVSAIVEEFAFRYLDDESVDVDEFCAQYPGELREEIRTRCQDAQKVHRSLRQVAAPRLPHRRIGEFVIERELGRGGMGVVYLARQESLDRLVALKVLALNPQLSPRAVKRFHREATSAG